MGGSFEAEKIGTAVLPDRPFGSPARQSSGAALKEPQNSAHSEALR